MNIFLCHSGPRSHAVAKALYHFLPRVIQKIRPFISDEDLLKGKQWMTTLSENLEKTSIGIVCLTPENLTSPWIHFEVGALFKGSGDSHVIPYLYDLKESQVVAPFSAFQLTLANQPDTSRLMIQLNGQLGDEALAGDLLKENFQDKWGGFEKMLHAIPAVSSEEPPPKRPMEEMIEELLTLARKESLTNRYTLARQVWTPDENALTRVLQGKPLHKKPSSTRHLAAQAEAEALADAAAEEEILRASDIEDNYPT